MGDINLFTPARAKKSLGQHFLRDERVVQRIVDLLRPEEGDQIMEIGPGPGALTALLRPLPWKRLLLLEKTIITPQSMPRALCRVWRSSPETH